MPDRPRRESDPGERGMKTREKTLAEKEIERRIGLKKAMILLLKQEIENLERLRKRQEGQ